jgi:alpha-tubulin suppressor-like RCC1 family protein
MKPSMKHSHPGRAWGLAVAAAAVLATGLATGLAVVVPPASASAPSASASAPPASGGGAWTQVATGTFHTCALRSHDASGQLWCWGLDNHGELGIGSTKNQRRPVRVPGADDWSSVTAGHDDSCGIRTDGSLWCWGYDGHGQLGDGGTADVSRPEQIGSARWLTVVGNPGMVHTSNDAHTCGIRSDHTMWCWGQNNAGQLGLGTRTDELLPTQVGTDDDWQALDAGNLGTCAVRTDATMWCWGRAFYGDADQSDRTVPTRIGSASDWATVATSGYQTCGLKTDQTLWCWGANSHGAVGNGTTHIVKNPLQIGTAHWTDIDTGVATTCGTQQATLWCWGEGPNASLKLLRPSPTEVTAGPAQWASDTSVSFRHGCAVGGNASLWCWGADNHGQLGDGSHLNERLPVVVRVGA